MKVDILPAASSSAYSLQRSKVSLKFNTASIIYNVVYDRVYYIHLPSGSDGFPPRKNSLQNRIMQSSQEIESFLANHSSALFLGKYYIVYDIVYDIVG